jgi:N-acetylglucosamine-6-sulfatase
MGPGEIAFSDLTYRRRLMTLRSLDDLIGKVIDALDATGRLERAHIFFTSDNGFHLGQFTMPDDKRLPYDDDLRVPLIVRSPGGVGKESSAVVLNIDLAPTVLQIAGLPIPTEMDGSSYLPTLRNASQAEPRSFLVEYHGEHSENSSDGQYLALHPPLFSTAPFFDGPPAYKMQDAVNNTYTCLRALGHPSPVERSTLYCEFFLNDSSPTPYFVEFYDLHKDPFQMDNAVHRVNPDLLALEKSRLQHLRRCRGQTECGVNIESLRVDELVV